MLLGQVEYFSSNCDCSIFAVTLQINSGTEIWKIRHENWFIIRLTMCVYVWYPDGRHGRLSRSDKQGRTTNVSVGRGRTDVYQHRGVRRMRDDVLPQPDDSGVVSQHAARRRHRVVILFAQHFQFEVRFTILCARLIFTLHGEFIYLMSAIAQ